MKRGIISKLSSPIAVIFFIFFSLTVVAQTYNKDYIDGRVYLKFKDQVQVNIPVKSDGSVDLDQAHFLDAIRQKYDLTGLIRPFDLNNDPKLLRTFELSFSQFDKIEAIKSDLLTNQDLEYVENVPMYYTDYTPNDSLYNREYMSNNWNWQWDIIQAEQAWDITKGSAEIKVAIVDDAVWVDHPDLANKIVLSHDVTTAGNQNSNPPSSGDPVAWSHGTHCAGLAGAETDNLIGVASGGFNVSLIGVKCSSNNPEQIVGGFAGINWAAANGADIISCSWGGSGYSTSEQNVINSVYAMGIVVVAAAGNDGVNTPHYPSGYNHVISVASVDETDIKSDFSNYGATIDVCSPGGTSATGTYGLLSTTFSTTTTFGHYDLFAGTSMACPVCSGIVSLILAVNPDLTPDEVENILKSSCDDIDTVPGNESYAGQLGAGRINAYKAVSMTPFAPTADFYTDVPYITPGTAIQFFDNSTGIPDSWSWEFTGGTPHLSSQQNPSVVFSTEGVYTIYLGVSNDFGDDVDTKTDYITVTSTPVPWIVFSASSTLVCAQDIVVFTDESLYGPTAWEWSFDPNTVTFVEGSTLNSENPHVRFNAPGTYSATLTASNANGSNSVTKTDMMVVQGALLNYSEDFESGESTDIVLSQNAKAKVKIDTRAAAPGSTKGLHFQGNYQTGGWSGGPYNTTPDQAWNVNTAFHGFADLCNVDATGIPGVGLSLDLKQTYSIGPTYSWFRVLVNDQQVADMDGVQDFNPASNSDDFDTKTFDLSQFGNSMFSLTLQSSCYLSDEFYDGDNVYVDNVMISNTTSVKENNGNAGVLTYPNPAKDALNYSVIGAGKNITVKVMNLQGQTISSESVTGYSEGDVRKVDTKNLSSGIYILQIAGDQGTTVKKFVKE